MKVAMAVSLAALVYCLGVTVSFFYPSLYPFDQPGAVPSPEPAIHQRWELHCDWVSRPDLDTYEAECIIYDQCSADAICA